MGISSQVLKDTPGTTERLFAIDHPLLVVEMPPEGFKGSRFLKMADPAGKEKITRHEAFFEEGKKLSFE